MSEDSIIAAVLALVFGGGGTHLAHRISKARDTGRDEAAIRREAKMEAAVENLVKSTEILLKHVESLRVDRHKHAQTLQHHENRISKIESDLRGTSGPIQVTG